MATEHDWTQLIRSRDITGGPVYTTNETYDEGSWGGDGDHYWGWTGYDEVGADWNEIGEIEDIVLDRSGQLVGVVAEVGGFLGIGEPTFADAILDRLVHNAYRIALDGPSLRKTSADSERDSRTEAAT